jgi:hypothetical protein
MRAWNWGMRGENLTGGRAQAWLSARTALPGPRGFGGCRQSGGRLVKEALIVAEWPEQQRHNCHSRALTRPSPRTRKFGQKTTWRSGLAGMAGSKPGGSPAMTVTHRSAGT